MGALLRVWVPP